MFSNIPSRKIYVVILNWNGWKDTLACLESVRQLEYSNVKTIIVDNNSEDDSWSHLTAVPGAHCFRSGDAAEDRTCQGQEIIGERDVGSEGFGFNGCDVATPPMANLEDGLLVVMGTSENLGFSGGCNLGIRYALKLGADYVLLLNNDACISPDAMTHLVNVAEKSDAAIIGAQVFDDWGDKVQFNRKPWPAILFGATGALKKGSFKGMCWPSPGGVDGAAMLLRRDFLAYRLNECGYFFDPKYFMYMEETDLCLYGMAQGYLCVVAAEAKVFHGLAKSSGGSANPRTYYYLTRNRVRLANRWLKVGWLILFHAYYVPSRLLLRLIRIGKERHGVARAVFCGLWDGYRGITGKWRHHGRRDV